MLTPLQERKQTHYFNLVDVDKNGYIESSDWEAIAQNLAAMRGVDLDTPTYGAIRASIDTIWQNLVGYVDTNRDNRASLEEWLRFEDERVINCDDEWYDSYVNSIVRGLMGLFDTDGDGAINPEEHRAIMISFNVPARQIPIVWSKLDVNGDGQITTDEMLQHVRDFHRSDDPEAPGNWVFGVY